MNSNGYLGSALASTDKVLAEPIVGSVDTVHLFLVTGIIIVAALVWSRILAHFPKGE